MKRFVVIIWDLDKFENVRLLTDEHDTAMIFPRRKEARDYMQEVNSEKGFSYRTSAIHI